MRLSATEKIIREAEEQDANAPSLRNRDADDALPDVPIDMGGMDDDADQEGETLVDTERVNLALKELRSYGTPSPGLGPERAVFPPAPTSDSVTAVFRDPAGLLRQPEPTGSSAPPPTPLQATRFRGSGRPPPGLTAARTATVHAPTVHAPPVHAPPVHAPPVHAPPVHAPPVHAQPVHAQPNASRPGPGTSGLRAPSSPSSPSSSSVGLGSLAPFEVVRPRGGVGRKAGILIACATAAIVAVVVGAWTARTADSKISAERAGSSPRAVSVTSASARLGRQVSPLIVKNAPEAAPAPSVADPAEAVPPSVPPSTSNRGSFGSSASVPAPASSSRKNQVSTNKNKARVVRKVAANRASQRKAQAARITAARSRVTRVVAPVGAPKVHPPESRHTSSDPDATLPITD